jgi:hypothetical protein
MAGGYRTWRQAPSNKQSSNSGAPRNPLWCVRLPPCVTAEISSHAQTEEELEMVTRAEAFPSRFLKADDLQRPVVLKVTGSNYEKLNGLDGKSKQKVVLSFAKTEKQLALNSTNFETMMDLTGENDSDNWVGAKIELYPTQTTMQGKMVNCIRIRKPGELPQSNSAGAPITAHAVDPDVDDDIPF